MPAQALPVLRRKRAAARGELRFLPLWEESSKEAHEGGEEVRRMRRTFSPSLRSSLSSRCKYTLSIVPRRGRMTIRAASNEIYRAEIKISHSDAGFFDPL